MSTTSADAGDWAAQYENSDYAKERYEKTKDQAQQREEQAQDAWGMKRQLQQARSNHTFTVEMYGEELPFNPLCDEASSAIEAKRQRMAECLEADDFEGFITQADRITENAARWLADAWDGDATMSSATDWQDTFDEQERMELLTKVDQRGEGEEMEAVLQFLGGG